ncbi:hypothetical protein FDZ74_01490, partial [bacterium]
MVIFTNILILIGLAVLGWLIGALLNYLADVLPVEPRNRSAVCPTCHSPYPVLDYLRMKSCRNCLQKRPRRSWVVQIASVLGLILLWALPPDRFGFWWVLPFMVYFALVAIIDIEHH